MSVYKITYSEKFRRANVYNYGCNFNCTWCSYKLKGNGKPKKFLSINKIKKVLSGLDIEKVHFVGGEPTLFKGLGVIADFAHNELGVYTKIGHSNGSNLPPPSIDAFSVSIKTLSNDIYLTHMGVPNTTVLKNFMDAYENGINVDASSVLIPDLVGCDEIEKIARFVADIGPNIPYHIVGYVPVPNASWRKPTPEEVKEAERRGKKHLKHVTSSCLTVEDFLNIDQDIRYKSVQVV